ncbi:Mom family adenine methylcarbamoylation protein [Sphingomonas sp. YL-JM2C]
MHTTRSQRWRDRRARYVPAATEIDPRCFAVDVIDTRRQATPFVEAHHYAGSMPVCRLAVGLFRNGASGRSELAGVCAFSVPINNASVPKNAGLADPLTACDLGRLVLLDDVGGNGESFLVARAFRLLRRERPGILSVISYADLVRRVGTDGHVFLPGHVGQLYATMGSRYVGRSSARTDLLLPDGRPISSRALSKIRGGETGQRYAIEQLVQAGARPPRFGEDRVDWLADLERSSLLRRRRHPGNHIYIFPLTRAARLAARKVPDLPYPRIDRACLAGDVTELPLLARGA